MTFGPSDDDRFRGLVGQNYGELEGKVGAELYAAQVDANKAVVEAQRKNIELLEAQKQVGINQAVVDIEMSHAAIRFRDQQTDLVKQFSAIAFIFAWLLILGGLAGVAFIWRLALGYT